MHCKHARRKKVADDSQYSAGKKVKEYAQQLKYAENEAPMWQFSKIERSKTLRLTFKSET